MTLVTFHITPHSPLISNKFLVRQSPLGSFITQKHITTIHIKVEEIIEECRHFEIYFYSKSVVKTNEKIFGQLHADQYHLNQFY